VSLHELLPDRLTLMNGLELADLTELNLVLWLMYSVRVRTVHILCLWRRIAADLIKVTVGSKLVLLVEVGPLLKLNATCSLASVLTLYGTDLLLKASRRLLTCI